MCFFVVRNLDFLLNMDTSEQHASFNLCSTCRNRTVSLGIPAEEMGIWMQMFYGDGRGQFKGGAVKESGIQRNRGSRMDDGGAKEGSCFKDWCLFPAHKQNVRSPLYSGSLCI